MRTMRTTLMAGGVLRIVRVLWVRQLIQLGAVKMATNQRDATSSNLFLGERPGLLWT